jgi:hypothetical protein
MNTFEVITNETLETINGGSAPRCNSNQRAAIRKQSEVGANVGSWVGGGLGLAAGGFTPVGMATMGAGVVGGALVGESIAERRGERQQGCRLRG